MCIEAGGLADAWLKQVRFGRGHRVAERGDAVFPAWQKLVNDFLNNVSGAKG